MKKFLFVGYDEDFEDTSIRIYEAESEEQVEKILEMNFYEVKDESELEDAKEDFKGPTFEEFTEDHPYIVKEFFEIDVTRSSEYVFEAVQTGLKNLKMFEELKNNK